MMSKPDVTIAIPTYNREEVLINTIHDCLNQSHSNIEVLVIDQTLQHSKDFISKLATIADKRLRYYYVDPPSVTAAKNFALHKALAPIIVFLDDDVKLSKHLVKNYLAAFSRLPTVSVVAGRVLQDGFPVQKNVLKFNELAVSRGVFTATNPGYTNAFPGGNVAMKVKDALHVGGFDTRYYHNGFREESDMSMKMAKAGMAIYYDPRAVLTHLAVPLGGSRTKKYTNIRDTAMFYRNELFFTIRMAANRFAALKYKYQEYCNIPSRKKKVRRSLYFYLGIAAAVWRLLRKKQTIAKERTA